MDPALEKAILAHVRQSSLEAMTATFGRSFQFENQRSIGPYPANPTAKVKQRIAFEPVYSNVTVPLAAWKDYEYLPPSPESIAKSKAAMEELANHADSDHA